MLKVKKLAPLALAATFVMNGHGAAFADSYDALCNGIKCKIILDGKGFTGPSGFIPSHRIAQWYTGGGEDQNQAVAVVGATGGAFGGAVAGGMATCWTVVLCVPGLIGGGVAGAMGGSNLGKSADFYFTVIGYNQRGVKTIQSFNFINKKPVGKIMQELPVFTSLAMGELRSAEQIKEADKRLSETGNSKLALPLSIGPADGLNNTKGLPNSI